MDTRNGNTSGPVVAPVSEEGEHFSKFTTHGMSTACMIPTDSSVVQKTLNAVSCLPTWVQFGGGPYLTSFPQDGSKLRIVYTAGLYNPINTAMAAWKTALIAAGRSNFDYELVLNDGSGCGTSGNCVQVGFNLMTCTGSDACGCSQGGSRSGGVYSSPSVISIVADWDDQLKAWIVGHELGHLFGLYHPPTPPPNTPPTCADGTTVMKTVACQSTALITATASDALPVSKAVYSSTSTK